MPRKQLVLVEAIVPDATPPDDAHPEHPIYIPITPPPETGLHPEHPIFIPVYPDISPPTDQPHPDHTLPGDLPRPDHTLPEPEQPVDPGYGVSIEHPEHPIYIPGPPVDPGYGVSIERPTHPIYLPVYPSHPIVLPPDDGPGGAPGGGLTDEQKEALRSFLEGNLPPYPGAPEYVAPVSQ